MQILITFLEAAFVTYASGSGILFFIFVFWLLMKIGRWKDY